MVEIRKSEPPTCFAALAVEKAVTNCSSLDGMTKSPCPPVLAGFRHGASRLTCEKNAPAIRYAADKFPHSSQSNLNSTVAGSAEELYVRHTQRSTGF